MDFNLTEEQQALRQSARDYAQERLLPLAEHCERNDEPPSRELLREFAGMGLLGVNVAERYGGLGLGNLEALIVLEQLARVSSAIAFPVFESSVGPVRVIEHYGSESLRQRVIPAVCRGEKVVAVSMSEPNAGSALTDLTTRGRIEGDTVVLNGTKRWCSGGGHADGYVVYCRLTDEPGSKGIGAVYVERGTPGLTFGQREQLMGFRGVPSSDLYLEDCAVPADHIIVPAGGFKKLMEAFDLERCGNATMALAQAAGALEVVVDYVQERHQFGKPVIEFQAVQLRLAEMRMRVDAARLLIWRAAANSDRGLPSLLESSIAKCFANESACLVCGHAVQLMGGYGYSREYSVERRLRDAWGWSIGGGTIDLQKVNIAASIVGRRFDQRR
ncbi:MAG: acyl-CoA dehydrogenase [Gammaproteobacteria bacterium]|nr:acyl-CoA dehydrogenase [Gammaproteobacteria bacterium]